MYRFQFTSPALLWAGAALALTLAACTPVPSEDAAPAEAGTGADHDAAVDPAKTPQEPDTVVQQPAPAAPPEPAVSPAECLVGSWLFSQDVMNEFYSSIDTGGAELSIDGGSVLSFTEEAYEFDADFTLTMDIGMTADGVLTGTVGGSYSASEDVLTTANETNDVSLDVSVMGTTVDATNEFEGFMEFFSINDTPYECADGELTLHYRGGGDQRVPLTLERID